MAKKKKKYSKPPGKKLKLGDKVEVTIQGSAARHPIDPRVVEAKSTDPAKGDVRIVIGGRWYVQVLFGPPVVGRPVSVLIPAENVVKL